MSFLQCHSIFSKVAIGQMIGIDGILTHSNSLKVKLTFRVLLRENMFILEKILIALIQQVSIQFGA